MYNQPFTMRFFQHPLKSRFQRWIACGSMMMLMLISALYAQPGWVVTPTGDNHTMIIDASIPIDINGGSLAVGDYLGVYFEDEGSIVYAGQAAWTGENISITIYGDDTSTPTKDGFVAGEAFSWKVWQAATGQELDATVTYQAPNIVLTHQGTYATDGISALASLTATGGGGGGSGPEWPVTITGDNHTIIIEASTAIDINETPIAVGDYLGVYFDRAGEEVFAGVAEWTGENIAMTVYGDDTSTELKDGYLAGETFQWKVWQASTEQAFPAEASYQPIGLIISHTDAYSADGLSALASLTVIDDTSDPLWEVSPTSENHTIVVPASAQTLLGDGPMAEGDYIGAFYLNNEGIEKCAGFGVWTGADLVFAVYGNDIAPLGKNGFNPGEAFSWKARKASDGQTYELPFVNYLPLDGLYTHKGTYAHNGISGLASFFTEIQQQKIALEPGWNLISSYIDPADPGMESIFSAIQANIALVKDARGASYVPSLGINQIGAWDYLKGYVARASSRDTLILYGQTVDPSTAIELPAGWSLMPYLSNTEKSIATVLSSVLSEIIEVKDGQGNSFIPLFGVNNIGNLKPGRAYKVRMASSQILTPSARMGEPRQDWIQEQALPRHFERTAPRSLTGATLVVPQAVAAAVLHVGDELGLFTEEGQLVGAAVFEGETMAIHVQGDDPATAQAEGLMEGKPFSLKQWKAQSGQETSLSMSVQQGGAANFSDGSLWVAERMAAEASWEVRLKDNPVQNLIRLEITAPAGLRPQVEVRTPMGQVVKQWQAAQGDGHFDLSLDASSLAQGVYLLQVRTPLYQTVKKIMVVH